MLTSSEEREREEHKLFWKVMACDDHTGPVQSCAGCWNKMYEALETLRKQKIIKAFEEDER